MPIVGTLVCDDASELGARVSARRRDVSLHSRSQRGARAMDVFTTIVQTSKKLGLSAYQYLCDRLSGTNNLPSLAQTIHQAAHQPLLAGEKIRRNNPKVTASKG